MQGHYTSKANSFSVYLPSEYGYPNEGNLTFDQLHERENISPAECR